MNERMKGYCLSSKLALHLPPLLSLYACQHLQHSVVLELVRLDTKIARDLNLREEKEHAGTSSSWSQQGAESSSATRHA